jgi:lysophospholipase L1-like esterase
MEKYVNIFLGGSIISQWNTSYYFLPDFQIINLGISKLTTNDLIKKYSDILNKIKNKDNIKNIVLYIGSNDVTRNEKESEIVNNIYEFIHFLQKTIKNAKIVFIGILKSPGRTLNEIKKIDHINQKMRELAKHSNNLYLFNFNRQLASINNYQLDKTHLSKTGYSRLSNYLKKILNE